MVKCFQFSTKKQNFFLSVYKIEINPFVFFFYFKAMLNSITFYANIFLFHFLVLFSENIFKKIIKRKTKQIKLMPLWF